MPRFAANVSMMFTEVPFLDRFARARKAGFAAVEFLFPYEHPADEIGRRLRDNGLSQVLFNAPPGDWAAGERGIAALPGRGEEFREGIRRALEYCAALSCPRLHVMAGLAPVLSVLVVLVMLVTARKSGAHWRRERSRRGCRGRGTKGRLLVEVPSWLQYTPRS